MEDKSLRVRFYFFPHFKPDMCAILGFYTGDIEFVDSRRCNGNICFNRITGLADQACDFRIHIGRRNDFSGQVQFNGRIIRVICVYGCVLTDFFTCVTVGLDL